MFQEAHSFNQPIGNWNVSNVTSLVATFIAAYSFNQNINNWNVSNVNDMYGTFAYCNEFNQPLNNWNVSNVTNMFGTFYSAGKFNQPLNNWNVSNVTSMDGMFYMEDTITNAAFNQDLSNWCVTQIAQEPQVFRYNAVNFTNTTLQPNWGNCGQPCNKPTDVNVTVNSATSATISWNAQNNATGYFVQVRVKGALGNWGGATLSTNSYSFNALQPNTIYEYRVRSVCSTQTPANGAFTLIGEFTTPVYVAPLPYCNAPTNINATVTGANSVTLTWTASEGAQQYFIQFKPSTSSWANSFGSTAYSTTKTFTNLVPNTTYDYRVRTTCVTGQTMNPGSTFSSINNFTTLPGDLSALFNLNESAWSIYPNPTHDLVQLEFTSSVEEALTIMVFDMTGRLVQSVVTQSLKGNNQIDISLGTLSNGMYIIKSRQGDAVTTLGKVTKN
jgi:surface protein